MKLSKTLLIIGMLSLLSLNTFAISSPQLIGKKEIRINLGDSVPDVKDYVKYMKIDSSEKISKDSLVCYASSVMDTDGNIMRDANGNYLKYSDLSTNTPGTYYINILADKNSNGNIYDNLIARLEIGNINRGMVDTDDRVLIDTANLKLTEDIIDVSGVEYINIDRFRESLNLTKAECGNLYNSLVLIINTNSRTIALHEREDAFVEGESVRLDGITSWYLKHENGKQYIPLIQVLDLIGYEYSKNGSIVDINTLGVDEKCEKAV